MPAPYTDAEIAAMLAEAAAYSASGHPERAAEVHAVLAAVNRAQAAPIVETANEPPRRGRPPKPTQG